MWERPKSIKFLMSVILISLFVLPLELSIKTGYYPWEGLAYFLNFSPLNFALLCVSLIQIYCLWEMSFLCVLTSFLYLGVLFLNQRASSNFAMVGFSVMAAFHLILFQKDVRKLLLESKSRFWKTPLRSRISLKTTLWPVKGGEISSRTIDVSESGLFIEGHHEKPVEIGARVAGRILLDHTRTLYLTGEVVRLCKEKQGRYPVGMGVRFLGLSHKDKQLLKNYLEEVRHEITDRTERANRTRNRIEERHQLNDSKPPTDSDHLDLTH